MGRLICPVVVLVIVRCGYGVLCQPTVVPEATLEFLNPKGLKISIPGDNPDVKLVAFHININEEFYGVEHGQYAADITKKKNGRWTWNIPQIKVKQGDIIYYWINIIEKTQGYNGLNREYRVTQANPHGESEEPNKINQITTAPVQTTAQNPFCTSSKSTLNGGMSLLCQGEVVLDKHFDNMDGWSHQVTIGGNDPEDEFMVFTAESMTSWTAQGKLVIIPKLLEDKYNDSFVKSGKLALEGCTSVVPDQCARRALHYLILPPIISARLNTKNKFSFRYGTVEIRAKLPRGNWIVPELWLVAENGPSTEKVVMGLSRGNTDDSEFGWRTLQAGVMGDSQSSLGKRTLDAPWSQDFHTFKLEWTPGQMKFFVDNQEVHRVSSVAFPILEKEVYISLGVHVAGSRDFPDSIKNKPWKNSDPKSIMWKNYGQYIIETYDKMERFLRFWDDKISWYPSWNQESSLQVEHIKITAI